MMRIPLFSSFDFKKIVNYTYSRRNRQCYSVNQRTLADKIVKNPVDRKSFSSYYCFNFFTRHRSFDSFAALAKAGCGKAFICPLSVCERFRYGKSPAKRNSDFPLFTSGVSHRPYQEI